MDQHSVPLVHHLRELTNRTPTPHPWPTFNDLELAWR